MSIFFSFALTHSPMYFMYQCVSILTYPVHVWH